jgi:hypothetical protein
MKRKLLYGLEIVITLVIVAFGYYVISPLFINIKVDENAPVIQGEKN